MVEQSDDTDMNHYQTLTWGTWEELLLACAVHRYGTKSWDSVTMELQKQSSIFHVLTPKTCEQKFNDLNRRFTDQNDDDPSPKSTGHGDNDKTITNHTVPWLDELKKLRVAELKRDVERYDLSIVFLQLKVKKLTEEREESLRESGEDDKHSDPEKSVHEMKKTPPDESSEHDKQSANESNSTDLKSDNIETKPEIPDEKTTNDEPESAGDSGKPAVEGSYNGSSDTVAKEITRSPVKIDPVREANDSSESSGGDGCSKVNSDVQSSVKSQPENDDQSPAIKRAAVISQPLIDFLEILRSHQLDSVFERRLKSQETTKYKSLIRQHIDFETIQTRLKQGWYSTYNHKFFRDLLLLSNNALIFYGKNSSESKSAIKIRKLVSEQISSKIPPISNPSEPSKSNPKVENAAPLISCHAKGSTNSSEKKSEKMEENENFLEEKRTRERIAPKTTSMKNKKSRTVKNPEPKFIEKSESKLEKKAVISKQGAADFLSRMKKGSSSSNDRSLIETTKRSSTQQPLRRGGSNKKQPKEDEIESIVKKNVGRTPVKRGAAPPRPPPSPPPMVSGKRRRGGSGGGGNDGSSRQAKKRSRK